MAQITPRLHVETRPITPTTGGIHDVAAVINESDPHLRLGVEYELDYSGAGGTVQPGEDPCGPTAEKLSEGFLFQEGFAFTIHHGVECWISGDDYSAAAERGLDLMQNKYVEENLWAALAENATDLTPGTGPVKPKIALGILLEHAKSIYPGVPVLHFGARLGVSLVGEQLVKDGEGDAAAVGGAQYINGGGYTDRTGPGGVEADGNTAWLYISGQVTLWRGTQVHVNEAYDLPHNKHLAIAEREYAAAAESFVAGIRVNLE